MRRGCAILMAGVFLVIGCGGGEQAAPVAESSTTKENIKAYLEDLSTHGQLNSGMELVKADLEKLKETEPEKADELLADYQRLSKLKSPSAIKKTAKEMADKL
ncbi:hypothetical protein Pan216_33290 [Planctomycetes bacterium Pan216]|uniref:Uncharacterized protein n=1 Tax=Kolteria novifilia TaxID=2527975 RepID=A0A518B6A6_9BACT|nr:hypothetical protein Pan216_33290 [Planctomycetes bacterium Pan216]